MWDARHVVVTVMFAGAPAAPDPASIYSGPQVIAIATDGSTFSNGDHWKCITCGVSAENSKGAARVRTPAIGRGAVSAPPGDWLLLDHPQPMHDGRRMIAGTNVVDCGRHRFTDRTCTPDQIHIYPIYWQKTVDGSGPGGSMRELRLHPDDVHLGWNAFVGGAHLDQFGYLGRLIFDPSPSTGTPLLPRYELEHVTALVSPAPEYGFFMEDPHKPGRLLHNKPRGAIGEFRGWTDDGGSALGNYWVESGNVDLFRTSLATGESIRMTRDPSYTDPVRTSPDDKWFVYLSARQSDRHLYYAGLQGIPPLIDMVTASVEYCCYNNGNRRFFQPYLVDRFGERGSYYGQQLNAASTAPGGPGDPDWNARADPTWSPDGTNIVYWQALVTAPACGGANPLACPESTEPGGRRTRLMIARLTGRKPLALRPAMAPISDAVPWGTAYKPGDPAPLRPRPVPAGRYILDGRAFGSADVEIGAQGSIAVRYTHFSDDGAHVIDGTESAERIPGGSFVWHSNLSASGAQTGTKITSEPGGFTPAAAGLIPGQRGGPASGVLTTTIDGRSYSPPAPGT